MFCYKYEGFYMIEVIDEKATILIVDDDDNFRKSLSLVLRKNGYFVDNVSSANEALEKTEEKSYNLVLLDLKLQEKSGLELIKPIKELHPDVIVMMITGYASLTTAVESMNLGVSAYITKPLDMDQVLKSINNAIEKQTLTIKNKKLTKSLQHELEERRIHEQQIVSAYKELGTIFNTVGEGLCVIDKDFNILRVNDYYLRSFGFKIDDVLNKKCYDILPHKHCHGSSCTLQRILLDKNRVEYESLKIRKNGEAFPCIITATPLHSPTGDIIGMVESIRDIAKQKKYEEELMELTIDLSGRVKELNCLYGVSNLKLIPDITIEEFLSKTVELIPSSWKYPEITTARIIFEEKEFKTHNFKESSWKQSEGIKQIGKNIGMIEVYYLEEKPEIFEGPFLKEERDLINDLAVSIGEFIDQKRFEEEFAIRHEITQIFVAVSDENVFGEILNFILKVMKSKYGIFGYINENQAMVCPSMTRDIWDKCQIPDKEIIFPRDTWGESIWARGLIQKKILWSNDLTGKYPDGHIPITRCITSPILFRRKVIGNLMVGNKENDYTDYDLQLMKMLSGYIAPLLHMRMQKDQEEKERKKAELALINSEQLYRTIFENTGTAMLLTENQKVVICNTTALELFGYKRKEIEGKTWVKWIFGPDVERLLKISNKHLNNLDSYPMETEFRIIRKNGKIRNVLAIIDIVPETSNTVVSIIDVTERKNFEEIRNQAYQQLDRNMEQFAILVDGIRNPLAVIVALADIYQKEVKDKIIKHSKTIDAVISELDLRFLESLNVRNFLKEHT